MKEESQRFRARYDTLFGEGGLSHVYYFVKRDEGSFTLAQFLDEANKIEDTIAAGDVVPVGHIDGNSPRRRFDAPF